MQVHSRVTYGRSTSEKFATPDSYCAGPLSVGAAACRTGRAAASHPPARNTNAGANECQELHDLLQALTDGACRKAQEGCVRGKSRSGMSRGFVRTFFLIRRRAARRAPRALPVKLMQSRTLLPFRLLAIALTALAGWSLRLPPLTNWTAVLATRETNKRATAVRSETAANSRLPWITGVVPTWRNF